MDITKRVGPALYRVALIVVLTSWPLTGLAQDAKSEDAEPSKSSDAQTGAGKKSLEGAGKAGRKTPESKAIEDGLRSQVKLHAKARRDDEIHKPERLAVGETRRERERVRLFRDLAIGSPHYIGKLRVTPTISSVSRYTDNAFLDNNGEDSDWQTRLIPAVTFEYPAGKHVLRFGFDGEVIRSLESPSEWNDEHYGGFVDADLDLPGELRLRLSEAYAQSSTDPGPDGDVRRHYFSNTASSVLSYDFGDKWSLALGYTNAIKRYRHAQDRVDDSTENAGNVRLYYLVLPKTSVFVDYTHSRSTRKVLNGRDSKTDTGSIGLKWDATAKLDGTVRVGYTEKDFRRGKGDSGLFYAAGLNYFFNERLTFGLFGERGIEETSESDRDLASGPSYMLTSVGLSADYLLRENWFLTSALRYAWSDYTGSGTNNKRRNDEYRSLGIGLRYVATEWFNVAIEACRSENSSDVSNSGYRENSITLTLNLSL